MGRAPALGLVGTRTLEGGAILAGVACILSLVSLRQAGAGTDALVTGHALITMYDRIFLLSQSFIPAVNALLIGSLLYQSRLVPRVLPLLGFTGATLLVAGDVAVLFGLIGQHASTTGLLAIPIAVWEFSLGVWLVVKGFKSSPITADYNRPVAVDTRPLADRIERDFRRHSPKKVGMMSTETARLSRPTGSRSDL
jgi:hypothetical protein